MVIATSSLWVYRECCGSVTSIGRRRRTISVSSSDEFSRRGRAWPAATSSVASSGACWAYAERVTQVPSWIRDTSTRV